MKPMMTRFLIGGAFGLVLSLVHVCAQSCGNGSTGGPTTDHKDQPKTKDPIFIYTGDEQRTIKDLEVWGGVGQHQLNWTRYSHSRTTSGAQLFGVGHNWRHSYQWEMADAGYNLLTINDPQGNSYTYFWGYFGSWGWGRPTGCTDNLTGDPNGNDFYLQRPNGYVYHFVRNNPSGGSRYYLMTDFTDTTGQKYTLTYNSNQQLIQVSEPGGRFLQMNYTNVNLAKTDFTTFASVGGSQEGTYTEVTVTDPNSYRYLRYLSPDGSSCLISEVEFYDANGNKLTGTPFGTAAASPDHDYTKAFDGNTNSYFQAAQAGGGFIGIDLGPGNATRISKVRFYPVPGSAWRTGGDDQWTASGYGQFQGANSAPQTIPAISSVVASDGRRVDYSYSPYSDPTLPSTFQNLTGVDYHDGNPASYVYTQPFPSVRPLVAAFNDPRYASGPMAASQNVYGTAWASISGSTAQQLGAVDAAPVATISAQGAHTPTYSYSSSAGVVASQSFDMENGLQMSRTEGDGRVTSFAYDGYGFRSSTTDAIGHTTTQANSAFEQPLAIGYPDGSSRHWTRNALDLPLQASDELGHTTTLTRDTSNRISQIGYPDGAGEGFDYNNFSRVTSHTLRNGGTESAIYDSRGLKTSSTDALGNLTTYTYDAFDRLSSVTDARSNTTSYQYDSRGDITQITYPDGSTRQYTYDSFANKLSETNEIGQTINYTYDEYQRKISQTDSLHRTTQWVYRSTDYYDKPTQIILPSGKITQYVYDQFWNVTSMTVGYGTADAATTNYQYDQKNRLIKTIDPRGKITIYGYDSRDRKTSQTDPLGHTTSWTYDAHGNVLTTTRPDLGVTTNTYDPLNRLLTTTDPKGQRTTYTYDASGNMLTLQDARGNTYTYTYDLLNRRTKLSYPDGTSEIYGYDSVGNMTTYVTRAGQTKTSVFDTRNREVSYTWSDGVTPNVTRTYDAAGRLLSSANGVSACTYAYDSANQLLSETQNAGIGSGWTLAYTYDADGNRASLTYPSGKVVSYGYTGRNQRSSIAVVGGASLAGYTYDADGNVVSKALSDGTVAGYTYDDANRLTSLNHSLGGSSFARFDYGYDNVNRRTYEQRDGAAGDTFNYDAVDQVSGVNYDAANPSSGSTGADRTVGYSYDATGNRTAVTDSVSGNTSYTANSDNQYTAVGSASYGYDGNGNLIAGNGLYAYDAQNRMTYAQVGSVIEQIGYDSKNRVVERTVNGTPTYYVYDGWDLIEERDASNNVLANYVHGVSQDEMLTRTAGGTTVFYHHNALGSVTDLTNGSGAVVEKYKYDVFGKPAITDGSGSPLTSSAYGNRFLFTGQEFLMELNLYDYRNRVYSSDLGRFLQTDPLRFSAGDVNIYRYCGNRAVNSTDPTGLCDNSSTTTVDANGNIETQTVSTDANGNTTVTETLTTSDGTTYSATQSSDGTSSESVTSGGTATTTTANGTTQTSATGTTSSGTAAYTLGGIEAAGAVVTVVQFTAIAATLITTAPITAFAVAFAGGVFLGFEIYDSATNFQRGREKQPPEIIPGNG